MNNMTYEEYMKLLDLGSENQGLSDQIAMQLEQAKALREGAAPEMRTAGRVAVAPHWLELAGGLAQTYVGERKRNEAMAGLAKQRENTQSQNSAVVRALTRAQTPLVNQVPDNAGSANGLDY